MSVATEIERIQAAKETLKTKLNAKNDSEHQITDELISDYGNFVDSITGGDNIYDYFVQDIGSYNPKIIQNIQKVPGINFSGTSMKGMFSDMYRLKEVDFGTFNVTSVVTNFEYLFDPCTNLKTVKFEGFDTSGVTHMDNMFGQCPSLTTVTGLQGDSLNDNYAFSSSPMLVTFDGVKNFGKAFTEDTTENSRSFSVLSCPNLSHDSLVSIIDNLYDLATAGLASQKLVLGETNLAKLTDEEKAVATTKGWNLS